MKLGIFAMIPQLNANVLNGSHQHHQKAKSSSSKVKSEDNACVFVRQQGNYSSRVCPCGTYFHRKFCLSVLERLWMRIRRVWPEYSAPGSWFRLHDNTPVHRAVDVQEFLARKQVCVLNNPPYSPDLSPCDNFLFPKLKLPLKGRLFEDVQDIQGAVTSSLRTIPQEDVQRSFQSLLVRATRCIDAEGMYFE